MGVSDKELSRFTSDGRLTRIGRGVYRIKHHVPGNLDPYAESVALAGPVHTSTANLSSPCSRFAPLTQAKDAHRQRQGASAESYPRE